MGDEVDATEIPPDTDHPLGQASARCRDQIELCDSQTDIFQDNAASSPDDAKKELDILCRRARITATLLAYLKSKARVMAVPHLAQASCGIKHRNGVGLIDKNGVPLAGWLKDVGKSLEGCFSEDTLQIGGVLLGAPDGADAMYMGNLFRSVQVVTDVMESLVKRVIVAESEVAAEKDKLILSKEEIRKKALQIASMSVKVEEMEKFAMGTSSLLSEMKQKVEDMVLETSLQRQRAAENEQELRRVKQDFESLRSYVSSLISMRDSFVSSEQHFQSMEKLFERLFAKTTHLEAEKEQKEAEVQKLLAQNAHLSAMLDKKEAQLLAMSEQCKFMALSRPDF